MKDYKHSAQSNVILFYRSDRTLAIALSNHGKLCWGNLSGKSGKQSVLRLLPSDEPRIYEKQNHQGNAYFRIDAPMTRQSFVFSSEQEVQILLKWRFYN